MRSETCTSSPKWSLYRFPLFGQQQAHQLTGYPISQRGAEAAGFTILQPDQPVDTRDKEFLGQVGKHNEIKGIHFIILLKAKNLPFLPFTLNKLSNLLILCM